MRNSKRDAKFGRDLGYEGLGGAMECPQRSRARGGEPWAEESDALAIACLVNRYTELHTLSQVEFTSRETLPKCPIVVKV